MALFQAFLDLIACFDEFGAQHVLGFIVQVEIGHSLLQSIQWVARIHNVLSFLILLILLIVTHLVTHSCLTGMKLFRRGRTAVLQNLPALALQVPDFLHLRHLSEDLNALDPSDLLFLPEASEIELEMAKNSALGIIQHFLNLLLVDKPLFEQAFQANLQLNETVLLGFIQIHRWVHVEQIQGHPEDLHHVRDGVHVCDLKVSLYENQVADGKVGDPLEFVWFETVLVFIPRAPVLSRLLGDELNVLQD